MTAISQKIKSFALFKSEVIQICIAVCLLFCCSQISIPLKPVPITLQTVAVLLIGLFYSRATAVKSLLSYLALGAMGAPVFANFSGGLHMFMGPRGGYLLGFLLAVLAMTFFRERVKNDSSLSLFINCLLGSLCIYLPGISWLSFFVGFSMSIQVGLVPFLIPGIVKALLLSQAVKGVQREKKRAVTLIEMIVVMLLIAMITGALAYNYNGSLNEGKAFKTREAITRIKTILSLTLAEESNLNPPELVANWQSYVQHSPLAGKADNLLKDGWNEEYEVNLVQTEGGGEEIVVTSKRLQAYEQQKKSRH